MNEGKQTIDFGSIVTDCFLSVCCPSSSPRLHSIVVVVHVVVVVVAAADDVVVVVVADDDVVDFAVQSQGTSGLKRTGQN